MSKHGFKHSGAQTFYQRAPRNQGSAKAKPNSKESVRIVPLGGVGEVGKNATAIECGQDIILVDAGVKFPEEEQRGIDLVIPDVSYLRERLDRLRGIVITHGHEDHIGALPFVLPQLARDDHRVPLYSARLTIGMIEAKLRERRALNYADLRVVEPGDRVQLGNIICEFIPVAHSIPGSFMVALHTPAGTVVMTGDFKLDPSQDSVFQTDQQRLRELGEEGVLALLSDCVRIERAGRTPPESLVFQANERLIREAKGRVIITTFASNIPRLEQAIISAHKLGRKSAIAGRSMDQNMSVAAELDYIHLPEGSVVTIDEANRLPDDKVLLLTTGSQGEPTSALARIASGVHPTISLHPGDTVVLSAEPVPGNTETVARTIDNLFRRGAKVIYGAMEPHIHVSGHASRDELRDTLLLLRPRYAVPVHGEYRHQWLYTQMAQEAGYAPENTTIVELGDVLEVNQEQMRKVSHVPAGAVLVDGLTVGNVSRDVLRDRQHLAADGVVVATLVVDRDSGELLADPEVIARGVISTESEGFMAHGVEQLKRALRRQARGRPEYGELVERTKESLGTYIWQKTHLRPLIIATITEM
jgi:ribonuclease J